MSLITVRKVEQAMWPRRVSKTCTNVRVIPSAAAARPERPRCVLVIIAYFLLGAGEM